MKLRAIKTIEELAIREQGITEYINGFIYRNIGEQGSDIKTSHDYATLEFDRMFRSSEVWIEHFF